MTFGITRKNDNRPVPHYTQLDSMDCGPTCLRMIARYYGRRYSLETLRDKAFITREEGVSRGCVKMNVLLQPH